MALWRVIATQTFIINMRNLVTVLCCVSLGIYGLYTGSLNIPTKPSNTATAAPLNEILSPIKQTVHDTVTVQNAVRDTVHKITTKTRIRIKRVPYPVRDTVSILYIKNREERKGTPPDSIPKKYIIHDAINANE